MRRSLFFFVGILLIAASVGGLAISITGIIGVWRVEKDMKAGLEDTLTLLDTNLQTTADGLRIAGRSLDQATGSLDTLGDAIQTTKKSVHDTIPLIDTVAQLTTRDLPTTISTTQQALTSAQSSARVVDSTLTILTSIPLLRVNRYQTQVPLGDALGDVSASLDPLPDSLSSMDESLANARGNLSTTEEQFDEIAVDIDDIGTSLTDAREVTTQYLQVVSGLQQQLASARNSLPGYIDAISWFVTVALVWLGLTQIGLMVQGLEMMGLDLLKKRKSTQTSAPAATPTP